MILPPHVVRWKDQPAVSPQLHHFRAQYSFTAAVADAGATEDPGGVVFAEVLPGPLMNVPVGGTSEMLHAFTFVQLTVMSPAAFAVTVARPLFCGCESST